LKKLIREYAPFIMLGYSFVFAVLSYFDFYYDWYSYLSEALGFSIFTNIFMYSVYMNKKYCTSTKLCVIGLIVLNLFNMIHITFDINMIVYDIYLITIVFAILILKKL